MSSIDYLNEYDNEDLTNASLESQFDDPLDNAFDYALRGAASLELTHFDDFKHKYPTYLNDLNNHISLIYNIYTLVCDRRFSELSAQPECYAVACRIGFGMLMRHTLEAISASITAEMGVESSGKNVHARLSALKWQTLPDYDIQKESVLFQALDITNEIAHPHITNENLTSYEDMVKFYKSEFRDVINSHISWIEGLAGRARNKSYSAPKSVTKIRALTNKYLLELKKQMDEFSINNKITSILLRGCLVRHLTECAANLWAYNNSLMPTDVSTFENQITISNVLASLSRIAREKNNTGFGTSSLTTSVVSNLFNLKNVSNSIMHVSSFNVKKIIKTGNSIVDLHAIVEAECSPHMIQKKQAEKAGLRGFACSKHAIITTLLCGFTGWFGGHHFYAGNIAKGIVFFLFGGFIIGPIFSLNNIRRGKFRSAKWGYFPKKFLTSFLSIIFIALHIFIVYKLISIL